MSDAVVGEVTLLLRGVAAGDSEAQSRLAAIVYGELNRLAQKHLRGMQGASLQPTALVHEAWLRLGDASPGQYGSRRHFLGVASKAMRSVLVDYVRAKRAEKRGGAAERLPLDEAVAFLEGDEVDLLDLNQALLELESDDPDLARWVEMRFFGGMTHEEIAAVEGCSLSTVERGWRLARARLAKRLSPG